MTSRHRTTGIFWGKLSQNLVVKNQCPNWFESRCDMTKCHFGITITEKLYDLQWILLQFLVQEIAVILCSKFQVILMENG
jgi:hypothetical protein